MRRTRLALVASILLMLAGCAAGADSQHEPGQFGGAYGGVSGGFAQQGTH